MNDKITLYDKDFKIYIEHDDIMIKIRKIGEKISKNFENKNVIVVEDIIDSGLTIKNLKKNLEKHNPLDITICSLFYKPKAIKYTESKPDYCAFNIDNQFIVGYGLDYNGLGRNLKNIYKLSE